MMKDPVLREFTHLRTEGHAPYHRPLTITQVLAEMNLADNGDVVSLTDIPQQADSEPPAMPIWAQVIDHVDGIFAATARFFPSKVATVPTADARSGNGLNALSSAGADKIHLYPDSVLPRLIVQTWGSKLLLVASSPFRHEQSSAFHSLWSPSQHPAGSLKYQDMETTGLLLKRGDVV